MSSKFVNTPSGVWKESNSTGSVWKWDTQGYTPNTASIVLEPLQLEAYDVYIIRADAEIVLEPIELQGQLSYFLITADLVLSPLEVVGSLRSGNSIVADITLPLLHLAGYGTQIINYGVAEFEPLELEGHFGMDGSITLEPLEIQALGAFTNKGYIVLEPLEIEGDYRASNNQGRLTLPRLQLEGYSGGVSEITLPKLGIVGSSLNPVSCHGNLILPHLNVTSQFGGLGELELPLIQMEGQIGSTWSMTGQFSLAPLMIEGAFTNPHILKGVLNLRPLNVTGASDYQAPFSLSGQISLPLLRMAGCLRKTKNAHADVDLPLLSITATLSTPNPIAGEISLELLELEGELFQGDYGFGVCYPTDTFTFSDDL